MDPKQRRSVGLLRLHEPRRCRVELVPGAYTCVKHAPHLCRESTGSLANVESVAIIHLTRIQEVHSGFEAFLDN